MKKRNIKKLRNILPVAIILIFALAAEIYYENTHIRVSRYSVSNEKIPPSFDGYKIVQLSDIHAQVFGNENDVVIDKIKNENPDLILITGDIVNNTDDSAVSVFENILDGIKDTAPIYAVTGNHDEWEPGFYDLIKKWEKEFKIEYLNNETIELKKGNSSVFLSGIPDPSTFDKSAGLSLVLENISTLEKNVGYNILMFHRADMLDSFEDGFYDLVFSGHMHGGQWRFPFGGGIISPDGRLCHPNKNGHRKASKNGMNRILSFVFERRPHLFHGSLDNEPLPT